MSVIMTIKVSRLRHSENLRKPKLDIYVDVHARSDSPHGGSSMQDYEYAGDYPMNTDPTVEPYPCESSPWYYNL